MISSLIFGFLLTTCFYTCIFASRGMHSDIQIDYVKMQIEQKKEPYYQAYLQILTFADKAMMQEQHAVPDFSVPGFYIDPEGHKKNSKNLQSDSFNAYALALAYRLSRKHEYGNKTIYFLNTWADKNKGYSEYDGPLVMSYSGSGLLIAADLMKNQQIWLSSQQESFKNWVTKVYQKASNEIRIQKNNWGEWGRYGSVLSAVYLDDAQQMDENIRLIKSDLFEKIASDGHMKEEVIREDKGLWYSYFSLAPLTAACWVILQAEGTNLLHWKQNGNSIQSALDYLIQYVKDPNTWPWYPKQSLIGSPETWPGNLFEAMEEIYDNPEYSKYVEPSRPIIYPIHHFAWTFPTLMKPKMNY